MTTTVDSPGVIPDVFAFTEALSGIEHYVHKKNGLQVLLMKQSAAPVVTFMVTYHVGSRHESTGLTGATHFLEHLMFKGTERFNKQSGTSVFNVLQRVGAQMNATTWFDRTNYYELLPKEYLHLAIDIEADRMRGARISVDDLESERTVILNEFDRGENEPIRKLYHEVWSAAYVAHPYHHPTIGWRSDIEQATSKGLRHFYDTYYWPNNATISIIGDFDREEALGMVEEHFGTISRAAHDIPDVRVSEPAQRGERRIHIKRAGELGALMIAFKTPEGLNPDTDVLDILSVILATGKNSRLYRLLTDNGLTTSAFASVSRLRDPGLFSLYGFLAPEKTHQEVEDEIKKAIAAVQTDGVLQDEVDRAINILKAQEAFGRDGSYAIASQLNEAIASGDWRLYAEYLSRIENITPEDVQRVASKYLVEDHSTIGWYIPE
ncbi:MAG: M16 family metallopeptidase [Rhodothermales bacterium]